MAHLVGEKGQVVIEIQPGFVAVQSAVGDHLEIRFFPPEHRRSLQGRLAGFARRSAPASDWTQTRGEAWTETFRQGGVNAPTATDHLTLVPPMRRWLSRR